jgi:hypothetical protein
MEKICSIRIFFYAYDLNTSFSSIKMASFSELTPSLTVTELKINVENLDYIKLGERFEPTKDVVAINSNFVHKAFDGYEHFLSKLKSEKHCRSDASDNSLNRRKHYGDSSMFNACIKFSIIIDESGNTNVIHYFPQSGSIQVFASLAPVDIFLHYLSECSLPEFSFVRLLDGCRSLLCNYKFVINIREGRFIDLVSLAHALESDVSIHEISSFLIKFIKYDAGDIHSKIAIVFSSKNWIHIWPKSGKVNIFGTNTELAASLLYDFICNIFSTKWDDFVCDSPTPDTKKSEGD